MSIVHWLMRLRNRFLGRTVIEDLVKMGLQIGKNVYVPLDANLDKSHCWLISLGDNTVLGPRVQILAHDASTKMFLGVTKIGRVTIGKRVFVGAGTVILPGVTIGDDVVIGAGSVVTSNIKSGSLVVGNPARVIGTVPEFIEKHRLKLSDCPVWDAQGWTVLGGITEKNKQIMREELAARFGYVE